MEEIREKIKVWCPKEFGNDEQGDFVQVQMLTESKGVFLTESLSFANSPKIGDVVSVDMSGARKESGAAEGLPVITEKKDIGLSSGEVREMERNKDFSPVLRKLGDTKLSQVSIEEPDPEDDENGEKDDPREALENLLINKGVPESDARLFAIDVETLGITAEGLEEGADRYLLEIIGTYNLGETVTPDVLREAVREAGFYEREIGAMKKQAFVSKVPGHKNSKGELAEWCIKSHKNNKILQSFTSEENAKKGLKSMEYHKHKASKVKQGDLLGDLMTPVPGASPELIEKLKSQIETLEQYLGDIQRGIDQTVNAQFHLDAMKKLFEEEKKENEGEERQSKLSDKEKDVSLGIAGNALFSADWKDHSKDFVKEKMPNQNLIVQGKSILDFDWQDLKKKMPKIAEDFVDWDFHRKDEGLTDGLLGANRGVRDESAQYAKGVLLWNDLSKEAKQYLKEELK